MKLIDADAIRLPKGFFEKVDNVPKFYEWLNTLPTIDTEPIMYDTGSWQTTVTDLPPVEYAPIKHGQWEQVEVVHDRKDAKIQDWQQARCSVCGKWYTTPYMYYLKLDNYCPNCGAKMDLTE